VSGKACGGGGIELEVKELLVDGVILRWDNMHARGAEILVTRHVQRPPKTTCQTQSGHCVQSNFLFHNLVRTELAVYMQLAVVQ